MDRRLFISWLGSAATMTGVSGSLSVALAGCSSSSSSRGGSNEIPDGLAIQLLDLGDSAFAQYSDQYSSNDLYQALLDKGVVSDTGVFVEESLAALAPIDAILEYQDFYYTETELQLYALAYKLSLV